MRFLEPGEGLGSGILHRGDGVAHAGLADVLDLRGDEANLARAEVGQQLDLGAHAAHPVDQVLGAADHELDLLALPDHPVHDPHQNDDAEIRIIPAVDQHRFQRRVAIALGRWDARDDGLKYLIHANAGLGAGENRVRGVQPDHFFDFRPSPSRVRRRAGRSC